MKVKRRLKLLIAGTAMLFTLNGCGTVYGGAAGAGIGAIAGGSVGTAALAGATIGLLVHDIPTRFADVRF